MPACPFYRSLPQPQSGVLSFPSCIPPTCPAGEKYTLRYTGGMVPDVFQIIVKEKVRRQGLSDAAACGVVVCTASPPTCAIGRAVRR